MPEQQNIEYKQSWHDDYLKWVCGFLVALHKAFKGTDEGGTIGGTIGGAIDDLTERQIEVLAIITNDNKITVRGLAEKLGINVSAAQEHFDMLKSKGFIERVGKTRGHWKVIQFKK
ncbi:MAG TPA: winged helix-turn-helix transcriptional regulator [Bacteroidales bacterium]|nr:winged helix-turn-helix transcriptional regulator [Bacteroidales bacterium]